MRWSQMFIPTLREAPAEAEVASHILLLRGGYIRQVASGIYSLLPLAQRVMNKIARIIREELDRMGAQEFFLPAMKHLLSIESLPTAEMGEIFALAKVLKSTRGRHAEHRAGSQRSLGRKEVLRSQTGCNRQDVLKCRWIPKISDQRFRFQFLRVYPR